MVSTMGRAGDLAVTATTGRRSSTRPQKGRLVETSFPFGQVSQLVAADLRLRDPVYGLHRWFARRPPTLVRSLLLAAHLSSESLPSEFWSRMSSPGGWLEGTTVYDPFMGGGTSLVEAARMGAAVAGRDVDPLAVLVVGAQLSPAAAATAACVGERLLQHLAQQVGDLFTTPDERSTPLHWFWL